MLYDVHQLRLESLILPCVAATEALARLDERISRSSFGQGFLERQDFAEAASSLWVDGELVHIEDLVLHDAHMDIRPPTSEMGIASRILRTRRQIVANKAEWALSPTGLARLRGDEPREAERRQDEDVSLGAKTVETSEEAEDDVDADSTLSDELSEIDRLIARSTATLEAIKKDERSVPPSSFQNLLRDPDWNEDERLEEWNVALRSTDGFPATLRAAIAIDAWQKMDVLQSSPWLGRQLASALIRSDGLTPAFLPALNTGLRAIPRERRRAGTRHQRLIALLDGIREAAMLGLKEHDRLLNAKHRMERRLLGRRSSSRMPELIALVLARPVVSTAMIVKALGTTPQGAVGLANDLELREMTGRGRFRAWGVL